MTGPAVIGVAGFKNAGKTTLVSRLVEELCARGFVVSTIKHAHHAFDIDQPGRDSFKHREAGAREVAIVSGNRWALMHELHGEAEPAFGDILARLGPCDIVIVEGYKREGHDKIEIRAKDSERPSLWPDDQSIVAIACDEPVEATVPVFARDAVAEMADFVVARFGLTAAG